MKTAMIQIDVSNVFSPEKIAEFMKTEIFVELVEVNAGIIGNPMYEFFGDKNAIRKYLLSDDYGMDEEDIAECYPQLNN